jgi:hypothetical protein
MADILDIVGTACQLAGLAIDIIKNCIGYYNSVREAPAEAKSMRGEVYSLLAIIDDLQIALQKHKEMSREPPNIRLIEEELKETRVLLKGVEKYTRPENVQGRPRLTWPLRRNPVRDMITKIQTRKGNLSILLQGAVQLDILERPAF